MFRKIACFCAALTIVGFSSCTSQNTRQLLGTAVANGADTQVRFTPLECKTLQAQCIQGDYQEWQTSDKQMGCSCKKL